jgi:hypothetical protein
VTVLAALGLTVAIAAGITMYAVRNLAVARAAAVLTLIGIGMLIFSAFGYIIQQDQACHARGGTPLHQRWGPPVCVMPGDRIEGK